MEENLRRSSYKLLLIILKFIPMITAFCYLLNTLLSYFNIDAAFLSILGGMSVLPWLFILLATYVFRFCNYHRMFLYYILVSDCISLYDFYVGIPIEDIDTILLQVVIAGIFLFLILYMYVRNHKKIVREVTG